MRADDHDMSFLEVYACVDEVFLFLEDHNNWGIPLLPQRPGCPILVFEPPIFYYNGENWECLNQEAHFRLDETGEKCDQEDFVDFVFVF